jgi:hypothetical protein
VLHCAASWLFCLAQCLGLPCIQQLNKKFHPPAPNFTLPQTSQSIFNLIIAWAVMFVPLIFTDSASKKVSNKAAWSTAIAFTTNIAFFPFLALRAAPEPPLPSDPAAASSSTTKGGPARVAKPAPGGTQAVPLWGRATGAVALGLCGLSTAFALYGRPEMAGGLAERAAYFQQEFGSNRVRLRLLGGRRVGWRYPLGLSRLFYGIVPPLTPAELHSPVTRHPHQVFWAFFLDAGLFTVWQALMLEGAAARYRFVPIAGLAMWLIEGGGKLTPEEAEPR